MLPSSDVLNLIAVLGALLLGYILSFYGFQRRKAQSDEVLRGEVNRLRLRFERLQSSSITAADESPPPPRPLPNLPRELIGACVAQRCVLFVGPGMAAQVGYPTWTEVLTQLVEQSSRSGLSREMESAVAEGRLEVVTELISARSSREELINRIRAIYNREVEVLPPVYRDLQSVPFAGILTTTWDNQLERTYNSREPQVFRGKASLLSRAIRDEHFFIAKLHGDLQDSTSVLLTDEEFRNFLYENPTFGKFLVSLWNSKSLFFVGMSITGIQEFLDALPRRGVPSQQHFAVLPFQPFWELEAERFRVKYGVQILWYQPSPGHPEATELIRRLRAEVEGAVSGTPVRQISSDVLSRIVLHNIGPFQHLSLQVKEGWNVLLGNNGSGKSTLLEAVALGLCGDGPDVSAAAARLLRVGSSSGYVELSIGDSVYRTDIFKEVDSVFVRSSQLTPVQRGRWVVIGFPPVRGVSTHSSIGPGGSSDSIPKTDDLLPLLNGEIDTRLDDLKQWLINLDVNSEPSSGVSRGIAKRNRQTRDAFFELLTEFLPDAHISFDRVDRETWQIYVKTDDGSVPLEQVSQGCTSVIGWIGTLLRRMYEIYGFTPTTAARPALVLVDELDAHLHPEWQQQLVPLVNRHFPKLQVLATTHSPLIVAGMDSDEVLIIKRDPANASRIELTRAPLDLEGLRADQILTSPLFGLMSSRSQRADRTIDRYAALISADSRNSEEEMELSTLREKVDSWIVSGETHMEREVEKRVRHAITEMEMFRDAETGSVADLPEDVSRELRRQLSEMFPRR